MKPGDRLEACLWFNSANPADKKKAAEGVTKAINAAAKQQNAIIGEIMWSELEPEDQRLPDPPESMKGRVCCLYGEADVLKVFETPAKRPFVEDLTRNDRRKLREITAKHWPKGEKPTREQIDDMIERLGPSAAAREALN